MKMLSPAFEGRSIALLFAVFIYGVMFAISISLTRLSRPLALTTPTANRVGALDGLRGVLALGVFVHHSVVAYRWKMTGVWEAGSNAVVYHLGGTGVALFFMITGFLFTRKSMAPKMRWGMFYRDRLARLGPLYFVLVAIVFVVVMIASDGVLHESPLRIALELMRWLTFGAFGRPDMNGYDSTWRIIAGVNWSLQYEVIFYVFAVPILYGISRALKAHAALLIILSLIAVLVVLYRATNHVHIDMVYAMHFLGGIAVAYAYSMAAVRRFLEQRIAHWIGAAAAVSLYFMNDNLSAKAVIASIVVFASVAGGASIFGLLKTRAAIWLGEISYGIYLLHGLILWLAFLVRRTPMSFPGFAFLDLFVGSVVVGLATISYLYLELPTMTYVKARGRLLGPKRGELSRGATL